LAFNFPQNDSNWLLITPLKTTYFSQNIDRTLTSAANLLPLWYRCFTAGVENNAKSFSTKADIAEQQSGRDSPDGAIGLITTPTPGNVSYEAFACPRLIMFACSNGCGRSGYGE
jgi:hypothetical protein